MKQQVALDRLASVAFALFVFIEWQYSDQEDFAWQLRFGWFVSSCIAVFAVRRFSNNNSSSTVQTEPVAKPVTRASIAAIVEPLLVTSQVSQPAAAATSVPSRFQSEPTSFTTSTRRSNSTLSRFSLSRRAQSAAAPQQDLDTSVLSDDTQGRVSKSRSFSIKRKLFGRSRSSQSNNSASMSMVPTTARMETASSSAVPTAVLATNDTLEAVPNALVVKDRFGFGPEAIRPAADFVYVRQDTWGYLGHLTPQQEEVLQQMKLRDYRCIESQSGAFPIDDACLLRFLRARKFDLEKADRMFQHHLTWRDRILPSSLTPNDISQVLGCGVARFGPYSRDGQPVLIVKVGNFDPNMFDSVELFTKYCAFFFERGKSKLVGGGDKAILFFDMAGWSLRKHATPYTLKLVGELINVIQTQNPERLSKCVLFNTPMLFNGTWKVIKQLLDPVVAAKILFVTDVDKIREFVDAEVLPVEYGGNRVLAYPIEGYAEMHPL